MCQIQEGSRISFGAIEVKVLLHCCGVVLHDEVFNFRLQIFDFIADAIAGWCQEMYSCNGQITSILSPIIPIRY